MGLIKLLLITLLAVATHNAFVAGFPDAIRCGADNSCCDGAMYFPHGLSDKKGAWYCQVYSGEDRCVIFNADGSYSSGRGHYDSRRGC